MLKARVKVTELLNRKLGVGGGFVKPDTLFYQRFKISPKRFKRICEGTELPTVDEIIRLCIAFDASPSEMLEIYTPDAHPSIDNVIPLSRPLGQYEKYLPVPPMPIPTGKKRGRPPLKRTPELPESLELSKSSKLLES